MSINLNTRTNQANATKKLNFGNQGYENPVNKKWEYYGAAVPGILGSAATGAIVGGICKLGMQKSNKFATIAGFLAGGAVALWTLPTALYHKSVDVFGKTKEMDVYSRAKDAEIKIAQNLDQSVKDDNLDESINRFYKYKMAETGRGMPIMNMNA